MKWPLSLTMRQLVGIGFPIYGAIGGCTWSIPFRVPLNDPCTITIYQQNMHTHVSFTVVIDTHVESFYLVNTSMFNVDFNVGQFWSKIIVIDVMMRMMLITMIILIICLQLSSCTCYIESTFYCKFHHYDCYGYFHPVGLSLSQW